MPNYRSQHIKSVQEFVQLIDIEKEEQERSGNDVDFLFRGQRRDHPLLPKLARINLREKKWVTPKFTKIRPYSF